MVPPRLSPPPAQPAPSPSPSPSPEPKPKPKPKPKPNQVLLRLLPLIPFNALNYVLAGSAAWPECPVGAPLYTPWAAARLGPSSAPPHSQPARHCHAPANGPWSTTSVQPTPRPRRWTPGAGGLESILLRLLSSHT